MVALTSLPDKHVTPVVGSCCVKNLNSAGDIRRRQFGICDTGTASLSTSGPKGAYVVVCEHTPSPSDDVKELV